MLPKLAFCIILDIRGIDSIDEFIMINIRAINGKITIIMDNIIETVSIFKYGSILFDIGRIPYANTAPRIIALNTGINTKNDIRSKTATTNIADVTVPLIL